MSSLQKFHRRTNSVVVVSPFTAIGGGSDTIGYWLGATNSMKLIVAPKTTELPQATGLKYGSNAIVRGTTSLSDGLTNTNTLYSFGSAAHPAAYYCKTITAGGYNTWYLPAKDELTTMYSNKSATPFATANSFIAGSVLYMSSSEYNGTYVWGVTNGTDVTPNKNDNGAIRPIRRTV